MTPIYIQLVTWNGEKYIPYLFESLRIQKFKNWKLLIWENASTDGTAAAIEKELENFSQPHQYMKQSVNTGFGGGHNTLFNISTKEATHVMLLNQDMMLDPKFIEKLYYFLESHDDVGAVSGRIMKWNFPNKTSQIDTIGLMGFPNQRVIDMSGGLQWHDGEDDHEALEVFGVSGALPLYRSEALKSVAYDNEFFDNDFFMYKEDVDLAWRMRNAGWHAFTVLDAVAHHDRSSSGPAHLGDREAAKNRKLKSVAGNRYSYRNHLLMLIKNYHKAAGLGSLVQVYWYELKKAVYLAIFETRIFAKSWYDVVRLLPKMLKKRAFITKHTHVTPTEINWWFRGK